MPADEVAALSAALSAHVAALLEAHGARVVASYQAMGGEPHVALPGAFEQLWPRCVGDTLEFAPHAGEAAVPGRFGIPEPDGAAEPPGRIDAVLVPGLAFSRRGARLGQGAGFYDRALAGLDPRALRVGVCYAWQLRDDVPMDRHDVAMTHVATELNAWAVAEAAGVDTWR